MCRNTWIFFSLIILPIIHVSQVASQCGDSAIHKRQDKLALYKITLNTYWTRIKFPKHYPDDRAPAQFGKLIGRTHDRTYTLYRLGSRLSAGITNYIETGQTHGIASEGNTPNVLDSFSGSGILRGDGTSTTRAFFDSNHTLVSMVSQISPSPDWFIGVDSFQLCIGGNWIDTVTVELDPLDAGTNEGVTFMATNQRTWPQNFAYRITSSYPIHPAGSFYYPNLPRLPPIATLTFTKLKEYTLADVYHEDGEEMEFVSIDKKASSRYFHVNENMGYKSDRTLTTMTTGGAADNQKYRYWTNNKTTQYTIGSNKQENARAAIIDGIVSSYKLPVRKYSHKKVKGNNLVNKPKKAVQQSQGRIIDLTHQNSTKAKWPTNNLFPLNEQNNHKLQRKINSRFQSKGHLNRIRAPRDCKTSDWSAWNACSRSCGVGETQRIRKIIIKARRGGKPCHALKETKWCGSVTPCPDSHRQIDNFFR